MADAGAPKDGTPSFEGERLLVTGGAGFIGSALVRMLLAGPGGPAEVTVLDKLTYAGNLANLAPVIDDPRLRFVRGDICDAELAAAVMRGQHRVLHLAAESHVDRSIVSAAGFVTTNVLGTQTLLNAAMAAGAGTFLHVSTDEVYGSIPMGSWPETDPLAPNSPYSASKASADLMCLAYARTYGMDVRITRCSNNYGPYQFPEKVIPHFVTRLMRGQSVPLYGDGKNVRDWLHVDDHCRGVLLALAHGRPGEVYNIGGGAELSNLELTHTLLDLMGLGEDRIAWVEDRKGHDRRYSVDWGKAAAELGYRPSRSFDEGLAETVAWYKDHPQWWEPLLAGVNGAHPAAGAAEAAGGPTREETRG
ncbi:dTDP-glucose 4,6-dehydratase [Streptomyces sp. DSM 44917]|uniref:dTDP-glucose 4,6-dehydratase n=1 Tax=Streptomyces boetiae TaxID=3075541 RepID=A0ABU2LC90_9ACTN|nr:dTDP-glucose 4,6-dehydratase [Streptomyces sp. DSM 44917]MDT0308878.1 dTDP-glucose 4,6-dehydratase [Streptomyces sp. DSM 44917]